MIGLVLDQVRESWHAFEIVFRAEDRLVSVLVHRGGNRTTFEFPHLVSDAGETLGAGDDADAAVRERAREIVVLLAAVPVWRRWWGESR